MRMMTKKIPLVFFVLLFIGLLRIVEVTNIVSAVPAYAGFYYDRGKMFDQQGETKEAIAAYETALYHNDSHMMAHYRLGINYGEIGRDDKKMIAFQKAADLGFEYDPDVFIALGQKAIQDSLYDEAINNYFKAIRLIHVYRNAKERHLLSVANFYLGDVYFIYNDFKKAFQYYSKAISFDRKWVEDQLDVIEMTSQDDKGFWAQLYYSLGRAYHVQRKYEKASAIYSKAIAIDGQFVPARVDLGYVNLKMGNKNMLREQIFQLEKMNEKNAVRQLKSYLNESNK